MTMTTPCTASSFASLDYDDDEEGEIPLEQGSTEQAIFSFMELNTALSAQCSFYTAELEAELGIEIPREIVLACGRRASEDLCLGEVPFNDLWYEERLKKAKERVASEKLGGKRKALAPVDDNASASNGTLDEQSESSKRRRGKGPARKHTEGGRKQTVEVTQAKR